jgi:hypothetical protein
MLSLLVLVNTMIGITTNKANQSYRPILVALKLNYLHSLNYKRA